MFFFFYYHSSHKFCNCFLRILIETRPRRMVGRKFLHIVADHVLNLLRIVDDGCILVVNIISDLCYVIPDTPEQIWL